jgi:dATP pyrophosphohydrolase
LLRRARPFDFWQSITGSLRHDEAHSGAAARELMEETGLTEEGVLEYSGVSRQFVIDARWRSRFAPGIVENIEFEWHYRLPGELPIKLCDKEHSEYRWVPLAEAVDQVWSWTNRDALRSLQETLEPTCQGRG